MRRSLPYSIAGAVIALATVILLMGGCGATDSPVVPTLAASLPTQPVSVKDLDLDSPTPAEPTVTPTAEPTAAPTMTTSPAPTTTPTALPTASATAVPPTVTEALPTATATPVPAAAQPASTSRGSTIVIDHRAVDDFDRIPNEYIQKASELRLFLRHASVSHNLHEGLRCLANNFTDRRPNFCDRQLPPEQVIFDPKYNPDNWTFSPRRAPILTRSG
jgi:hypothetical protein